MAHTSQPYFVALLALLVLPICRARARSLGLRAARDADARTQTASGVGAEAGAEAEAEGEKGEKKQQQKKQKKKQKKKANKGTRYAEVLAAEAAHGKWGKRPQRPAKQQQQQQQQQQPQLQRQQPAPSAAASGTAAAGEGIDGTAAVAEVAGAVPADGAAMLSDATFVQDRVFAGLQQFNCEEGRRQAGQRHRLAPSAVSLGQQPQQRRRRQQQRQQQQQQEQQQQQQQQQQGTAIEGGEEQEEQQQQEEGAGSAQQPRPRVNGKQHGVDTVEAWFGPGGAEALAGATLPARLAHALAARRAIDLKEFCEAFEFFTRTRKALRKTATRGSGSGTGTGAAGAAVATRVVVDLCCGHGLTGILFAVFERTLDRVLLVDQACPPAHAAIFEAACEVAPWVKDKVTFRECTLQTLLPPEAAAQQRPLAGAAARRRKTGRQPPSATAAAAASDGRVAAAAAAGADGAASSAGGAASADKMLPLPEGAAVLSVHACGIATDLCIDVALRLRGNVAVMPCCYRPRHGSGGGGGGGGGGAGGDRGGAGAGDGPAVLEGVLGRGLHADVLRTQRLHAEGYAVEWSAIPRCVTPKNRIIVGKFGRAE